MSTLIKNGMIVTASDQYVADILIEGETIKAIGREISCHPTATIDARGKYVFPGGIDGHVHLGQISSRGTPTTGFETTPAAISGGTTTVIAFSPQYDEKGLVDSALQYREEQIEGKSGSDPSGPHHSCNHTGRNDYSPGWNDALYCCLHRFYSRL